MEFGKPFSYVFEDPDWLKKVAIMALITIIPILGQLVLLGWTIDIIKKLINHEPLTLPNLDFGGQLSRGFGSAVISVVYSLPIIIIAIIHSIVTAVAGGLSGSDSSSMSSAGGVAVVLFSICFFILYFIFGVVLAFILPIAYGRYAEYGRMGEGLKFGLVFGMARKVPVPLLIVILGSIVASLIASAGSIACGIGVLLTTVYSAAIMGHFYGQVYNLAKGETPA